MYPVKKNDFFITEIRAFTSSQHFAPKFSKFYGRGANPSRAPTNSGRTLGRASELQMGPVNFKLYCLFLKSTPAIEEISIVSNNSHLEWRAGPSDTTLKGTQSRTTPARFGLIWFSGFRGEDLNVKVDDDGSLWLGELKS